MGILCGNKNYADAIIVFIFVMICCSACFADDVAIEIKNQIVEIKLPQQWKVAEESFGKNMILLYDGPPGLSAEAAGTGGYDGMGIKLFSSDKTKYSQEDKEFFVNRIKKLVGKFSSITGMNEDDVITIAETDTCISVLCFLKAMCRITGTRLVDNRSIVIDMYIRNFPINEDQANNYIDRRVSEYMQTIDSIRIWDLSTYEGDVIKLKLSPAGRNAQKIAYAISWIVKAAPYVLYILVGIIVFCVARKRRRKK